MKTYYWIAINGTSITASAVPLPTTLAVTPVPQRLIGFDSADEARETQQFLLAASTPECEERMRQLDARAERGEIISIVPNNPEPVLTGLSSWIAGKVHKRWRNRRMAAYHEAGHAAAQYFLELPFSSVYICPDAGDGKLGAVRAYEVPVFEPYPTDPAVLVEIESHIMVAFAGVAAVARYKGRLSWTGGHADFNRAFDLALVRHHEGTTVEVAAFLEYVWVRTQEFVKQPRPWAAIIALAEVLEMHNELSFDQVQNVIGAAVGMSGKCELLPSAVERLRPSYNDGKTPDTRYHKLYMLNNLRRRK